LLSDGGDGNYDNSIRCLFTSLLSSQGRLQSTNTIQQGETNQTKKKQLNHLRVFKLKRKFLKISVALQATLTEEARLG
jgi:hypothetical protein